MQFSINFEKKQAEESPPTPLDKGRVPGTPDMGESSWHP
jgi:hypothetical protein